MKPFAYDIKATRNGSMTLSGQSITTAPFICGKNDVLDTLVPRGEN
jgi:hypothetical protein